MTKMKQLSKFATTVITVFTLAYIIDDFFKTQQTQSVESTELSSLSAVRINHAQELLGASYPGSAAEQSSSLNTVNPFVFQTVQKRLNKKHKKYAEALTQAIVKESHKHNFDPMFVLAVIQTESDFNPILLGRHGEVGLMQIKPSTAKWIAQKQDLKIRGAINLKNPSMNVKIGVAYLAFLRTQFEGRASNYVAAYNMGPSNVRRLASQSIEPKEYPERVIGHYKAIYSSLLRVKINTAKM